MPCARVDHGALDVRRGCGRGTHPGRRSGRRATPTTDVRRGGVLGPDGRRRGRGPSRDPGCRHPICPGAHHRVDRGDLARAGRRLRGGPGLGLGRDARRRSGGTTSWRRYERDPPADGVRDARQPSDASPAATPEVIWGAARGRTASIAHGPPAALARAGTGSRVRGLRRRVAVVSRGPRRLLVVGVGVLRCPLDHRPGRSVGGRRDARRPLVPRRAPQLRRACPPARRTLRRGCRRGRHLADPRPRGAARRRPARPGRSRPRRTAPTRRPARRPGGRVRAQHPRGAHRIPRDGQPGCDLVLVRPELGVRAVIDRFGQLAPKVLLAVDGYRYGTREIDRRAQVAALRDALPTLQTTVEVPYLRRRRRRWCHELARAHGRRGRPRPRTGPVRPSAGRALFVGHDRPPKAIVHGHGGILLEHLKAWRSTPTWGRRTGSSGSRRPAG